MLPYAIDDLAFETSGDIFGGIVNAEVIGSEFKSGAEAKRALSVYVVP